MPVNMAALLNRSHQRSVASVQARARSRSASSKHRPIIWQERLPAQFGTTSPARTGSMASSQSASPRATSPDRTVATPSSTSAIAPSVTSSYVVASVCMPRAMSRASSSRAEPSASSTSR